MYCRQCGAINSDAVATCSSCGAAMPAPPKPLSSPPLHPAASNSGNDGKDDGTRWASNDSGNPYAAPVDRAAERFDGATPSGMPPSGKPESYLVPAILVTFCCCLPFGIPAIVYAAQVDSKWSMGDLHGAKAASLEAKKWMLVALFVGLGVQVLPFLFYFVLIILAIASGA